MAAPPPSGAPPRLRSLLPRCPPWPAVAQAILESAPNALVQLYALIVWAHPLRGPGRSELAALLRVRRGGVRGPGAGHVGAEGAVPGLRRLHLRCGSDAQPGDRLAYADVGHLRQPDASVRPVVDVAGRLWRHGGPHSRAPVRAVHVRPVRGPAAGAGEPRAAGVALGGPDHAVPKDSYYLVRILEFVLMWVLIVYNQDRHLPGAGGQAGEGAHRLQGCRSSARWGCTWLAQHEHPRGQAHGWVLPFVWRIARRHELSRDVVDWGDDEAKGDSDFGDADTETDEEGGMLDRVDDEDLPPE
ncbi:unnamed protein product [Prorocentrum cordatum]|uniref:Uncharacterized protein n=1 Tax=Prorocentrum cordatum TaxID=2364126 RepID=A0ABN9VWU4_9DINO|nr:unnamed protein product [Polarella glacialis]